MPTKVGPGVLAQYVGALTGIKPHPSESCLDIYLRRVFDSPSFNPPWSTFDIIDQRCSFIESVMLGRTKSIVLGRLEESEEVTLVGIEQSQAFVGKHSVFVAFALDSATKLAEVFSARRVGTYKKGFPVCTRFHDDRVYVTCPLSAFVVAN